MINTGINSFTAGETVVYEAGAGSSVAGLTAGNTYYVIASASNANEVSLAASAEDAAAGNAITLGAVTGSNNNLFFSNAAGGPTILHGTFGQSAVANNSINVGVNAFSTGEAVVYEAGANGSVAGLTSGDTYYVIKSASDPNEIGLADSAGDAALGNALTLGAVAGSTNYLSDGAVLSQRAVWSTAQLENSVNSSILAPKTGGSTQYETYTDITGRNIYLTALNTPTNKSTGNIGVSGGTLTINLPLTDSLPQAEQLALAAAMPEDVTFYTGLDGTGTAITNGHLSNAESLTVNNVKSVDIVSTGTVDFVAAGNVNVGTTGGLVLEKVSAGGEVRLTTQEGISTTTGSSSNPAITCRWERDPRRGQQRRHRHLDGGAFRGDQRLSHGPGIPEYLHHPNRLRHEDRRG